MFRVLYVVVHSWCCYYCGDYHCNGSLCTPVV